MNDVIGYLKSIFKNKITFLYNEHERNMPLYLTEQFVFLKFKIDGNDNKYILTESKEKIEIKINTIRKQISQIKKFSDCIPVMVFDELRLTQRNALIQADFPFVVPDYQVYIPNVMFNLLEKDVIKKEYNLAFSVPTQVVFIYLLLNGIKETNARKLLNALPFSVATINRALNELVARELLYTVGSNTRKTYRAIEKNELWDKGKEFLFNPVAKTYYIKNRHNEFLMSNELALARLSWSLNDSRLSYYAVTADEIAKEAEFFSFGTNDLTQMTFGFSRDDAGKFLDAYYQNKIYESDPFAKLDQTGVGQLVEMAVNKGRATRPNIKLGICGEHGGDPSSVEFCHKVGLTYVSCSPFRVPIARLAAAQAAINNGDK